MAFVKRRYNEYCSAVPSAEPLFLSVSAGEYSPIPLESRLISSFVGSLLCEALKAFSHPLTDALTVGRSITA